MGHRLEALDSVRGIAAASVVIQHVMLVNGFRAPSAHWAVLLFFVLSGTVLALPWVAGRPPPWPEFILRRVCRLWPPVAFAVLVSVLLLVTTGRPGAAEAIDGDVLARCLLLTGQPQGCSLDTPLWSLVYELRISVAFPLLVVLTLQRRIVMLGVALWFGLQLEAMAWISGVPASGGQFVASGVGMGLTITLHYAALFVFGILIARRVTHGDFMRTRWALPLLGLAIALIALPSDTVTGLGAALLIVVAAGYPGLKAILLWAPLRWLGKVSYSLYLLHLPIIIAVSHGLGRPVVAIPVAMIASALAAEATCRLIEAASIRSGRWLAVRYRTRSLVAP
jgi:peptidoglycan/LPS O-acetylase OafA/YrhL